MCILIFDTILFLFFLFFILFIIINVVLIIFELKINYSTIMRGDKWEKSWKNTIDIEFFFIFSNSSRYTRFTNFTGQISKTVDNLIE